jgi:hypothetical protein
VFRVLKPGAHLLAFGGTRTYHRMTCAIEDAGFEIRDSLHWIYGSGFPKSLNVSKAIDAVAGRIGESVVSLKERLSRHFDASGKTHKQVDDECGFRASNYLTLPADGKRPDPWVNVLPSEEKWTRIKEVLGCPDDSVLEEAFRAAVREVVGQQTKARSEAGKSALPTLGADVKYETWDVTTPATDIAKQWAGFGTALKPSHEPIVLARKPLDGTVAGNVAEHGTGAMNIDGCRIPGHPEPTRFDPSKHSHDGWRMNATGAETAETAATVGGRWPSNLVLTHHPDCRPCGTKRVKGSNPPGPAEAARNHGVAYGELETNGNRVYHADADGLETVEAWECVEGLCPVAEMDRQSGELRARGNVTPTKRRQSEGTWGRHGSRVGIGPDGPIDPGDSGGASRFFPQFAWEADDFAFTPFRYCAKASREERNAGLDGMPERRSVDDDWISESRKDAPSGGQTSPQANHHPTVKPVALVQWLCRLITPPGGLILDCFLGSGTTGVAAIREGFRLIGIEDDPEYIAIAEARIAEARRRLERPHAPAVKINGHKRRTKTTPLFDLLDEGTDP